MSDFFPFETEPPLDNRMRVRTLINLRWVAIGGQTLTLILATSILNLEIELVLCFLVVGASVLANVLELWLYPVNKRLSNRAAALTLFFDIAQLSLLLFLTGGLHNPFALLIIVPVTVSATALSLRATLSLGAVAFCAVSLLAVYHIPLRTQEGGILVLPDIFLQGLWVAIVIGAMFMAIYAYRLTQERNAMSEALFATQVALAREQKLTDIGGVVAAYAHEMGTPLATITLIASELADDLKGTNDKTLQDDVLLLRAQAYRCRDILNSMGRASKEDQFSRRTPLSAILREAAEPHEKRGISIEYKLTPLDRITAQQPEIWRKPEVIHGLRNLVQNAVDFAQNTVWIDAFWSEEIIQIRISDDGNGFPTDLIPRIGDPFLKSRTQVKKSYADRENYNGLGLGLFIAITLLKRTKANVTFANGVDHSKNKSWGGVRSGAVVDVEWNRSSIEAHANQTPPDTENVAPTA